jgi:membrane associated rhomboid family serine protease
MTPWATIIVLIGTAVVSALAFRRPGLWERLMFKPLEILRGQQYERLLTSGLIHADWGHLAWNALSFFLFGRHIEAIYGPVPLLAVYLAGILGGSLLSLVIHRNDIDYRALGASGGVCGVIFASIFLLPGGAIYMFFIPIGIPPYLYAIIFLVTSFISHRRKSDNIGHDAHLGGAIVGLLTATVLYPQMVFAAPLMFATVLVLALGILFYLIRDPGGVLEFQLGAGREHQGNQRYQRYDEARERREKLEEIDRLLDKVAAHGIGSLSNAERQRLERLSKEVGGGRR